MPEAINWEDTLVFEFIDAKPQTLWYWRARKPVRGKLKFALETDLRFRTKKQAQDDAKLFVKDMAKGSQLETRS